MLQSVVATHFRDQATRLLVGDLNRISDEYSFPLPIHFPTALRIAYDLEGSRKMLEQRRAQLEVRGIVVLRPTITAMELPRSGRFRVWIDWTEVTDSGAEISGSSAIYFCRMAASGLQTEMIQYTHLSPPGLLPREIDLALSA